jgi:hypothetical protein
VAKGLVNLEVSITDLPEILAVLLAARDVVDHATVGTDDDYVVSPDDFHKLKASLAVLMPGTDV